MASKNFLMISGDCEKEARPKEAPKEISQTQAESSDQQKLILFLFNNTIWICMVSLQEIISC